MRCRSWSPLLALVLSVGVGCGDPARDGTSGTVPEPVDPLAGRTFIGETIEIDGTDTAAPDGGRFEIDFRSGTGAGSDQLTARAACNHLGTEYRVDGNRIVSGPPGGTDMGCPPEHHAFDELLGELITSPRFDLTGTRLVLTTDDGSAGALRAVLVDVVEADPPPPLEGTRWTLDALVEGDTVSSLPAGVGPVTMSMDSGELSVDTGCNGVHATYELEGSTMTASVGWSGRRSCGEDLDRTEAELSRTLEGTTTVDRERRTLRITAADGRGLVFIARG